MRIVVIGGTGLIGSKTCESDERIRDIGASSHLIR